MNNMQDLFYDMSQRRQRERSATQMTLGGMIGTLKSAHKQAEIKGLGELYSYRGYYIDLAFEPDSKIKTAAQLLDECKAAMGGIFAGYKGGQFVMESRTPLWLASCGCGGEKIIRINGDGTVETARDDNLT